jgi:glycerol-3-phosphate dehydrogenase
VTDAAKRQAELPSRAQLLTRLDDAKPWDVIVVGGGATGLGVALDAVSRGFRTLLVEAGDFASGSSSRSTKLVHGGVRYLAQGNVALVREALAERALLLQNAPHLAHPLGFIVPTYRWHERMFYGAGLKLYAALAGERSLGDTELLGADEVRQAAPGVNPVGLRGGVRYWDGQFDDARLAIALMRTAQDAGATLLNYLQCTGISTDIDGVCGVRLLEATSGRTFRCNGRLVINATGVWVDRLRSMVRQVEPAWVSVSQGVHIALPANALGGTDALLVPRTSDGRVLFAVPWHGVTLLGTTDTARRDAPVDPRPLDGEVDYLLRTASPYLARQPARSDILATFCGLRPLIGRRNSGAATKSLSREHAVIEDIPGLISVTGGKWTTYRRMAEDVMGLATRLKRLPARPCRTHDLRLCDAVLPTEALEACILTSLSSGTPNLPLQVTQQMNAMIRNEAVMTVDDLLFRRLRIGCTHERESRALRSLAEGLIERCHG